MQPTPLRTTVIGSYPFPGWLELARENLGRFGTSDLAELQDDAVTVAVADQVAAGLDVITDGEQSRLDFNLSFYGYLEGIEPEEVSPRRFGAGPVVLIVSNQTGAKQTVTLETDELAGSGPGMKETSQPIQPRGTGTLQVNVREGSYALSTSDGPKPARFDVGPARRSGQDQLLQP